MEAFLIEQCVLWNRNILLSVRFNSHGLPKRAIGLQMPLTGCFETLTSVSGANENKAFIKEDFPTLLLPRKQTCKKKLGYSVFNFLAQYRCAIKQEVVL